MSGDDDFEAFAVLVNRSRDIPDLVAQLSERLERALPEQVEVSKAGVFGGRRVKALVVTFHQERLRLEMHGNRPHPTVDHVVHGVVLKSDALDFDTWLQRLRDGLAAEAESSTTIRLALEDALR
jgi:hypothetical protein